MSGEEALRGRREHKGLLNKLQMWKVEPASKEQAAGNNWAALFHYCVANTLPRFPAAAIPALIMAASARRPSDRTVTNDSVWVARREPPRRTTRHTLIREGA